jgi:hypothetical protein
LFDEFTALGYRLASAANTVTVGTTGTQPNFAISSLLSGHEGCCLTVQAGDKADLNWVYSGRDWIVVVAPLRPMLPECRP